ncbi:alkaline phosphatase D family protein [Peribacillus butanolivorans]|uniref:alkaline phosphatase D family protein n=1 Tax=Peribacillus butanolivorans TaxID=421767 RepID=UPI0036410687
MRFCQLWVGGRYTAYRDMSQGDFDFVFHLGDYIYEKKTSETLADFCIYMLFIKLHQSYRLSMQRFPFIVTIDDHEVENDWANGISQPDGEESNQNFLAVRAATFQAYYEHLPNFLRNAVPVQ